MSTRERVLQALRAAGGSPISGEAIARELDVSRVAVGKHVQSLRAAGYDISAQPGEGYRLVSPPDTPLPAEIRARVHSSFWQRFEGSVETGSTNDDARELARKGAPEGTVVTACRQTAGRGRLGRAWSSPEGGVYLSVVFRPALPPADVPSLALAVGLAVARALEGFGVSAVVKWPNDVLLGKGKLAGVLLEMSAELDRVDWVVAGVGLNVTRPASGADPGAAYLSDVALVPAAEVAARVLDALADTYDTWCRDGFTALRAQFERRHSLTGQSVVVRTITGEVEAQGTVVGIDDSGRLALSDPELGPTYVAAGEVTLRD